MESLTVQEVRQHKCSAGIDCSLLTGLCRVPFLQNTCTFNAPPLSLLCMY